MLILKFQGVAVALVRGIFQGIYFLGEGKRYEM
jgi:hypothetical protein